MISKLCSLRASPPASSKPAKQQPASRVIVKKISNLCDELSKNIEKLVQKSTLELSKNPPEVDPKWRKSEPGGTPKRRREAKMEKRVDPSNSLAVLLAILDENWSQDGGQNRPKINKKVR